MQSFHCPTCGGRVFFDNLHCSCGQGLYFDPDQQLFHTQGEPCSNRTTLACNWQAAMGQDLCASCMLTSVHPDLTVADNNALWALAEGSKRRVLAGLYRWGWFSHADGGSRPEFHMLSEATASGPTQVSMGHQSGVVTINLAECDATERVRRRENLGESYRTMVGHFRHEIAHFLYERLCEYSGFTNAFAALFGDVSLDYALALNQHYQQGPQAGWEQHYISSYASSHPHEDWAESAAHALHLVDLVDSFHATSLASAGDDTGYDAYADTHTEKLLQRGLELGIAFNHVSRGMGLTDLYPFVTPPQVRDKLHFAHQWLSLARFDQTV
nr:putative zinc-binding metallopeptidase [Oceanococcus sp. HetDA_MAG_MS8]